MILSHIAVHIKVVQMQVSVWPGQGICSLPSSIKEYSNIILENSEAFDKTS